MEPSAADMEDAGVFFVSMNFKGETYSIPVQSEDSIASIFDFAQEALDFPRENCKLLHKGKQLRPDHDSTTIAEAGLSAGAKLMLIAVSAHDVNFVQSSRADPLVKGFAEEERDELNRRKRARAAGASAWGTKQDSEYKFASIKAEFKYSEPPPYEAEKLLQKLSTDPGIIDIMKTRKFNVGILTEMSPVEAQERMAKRGTPNMDLLGYNQNAGEMIVLRLRTDNLKGFRAYQDLINTLIHELTHNVWGPHDHNFWKLYGELKAQYMRFHRFWSHGGHAADSNATGQFQGFMDTGEEEGERPSGGFGQVLGSAAEGEGTGSIQTRAAAAAEARLREATAASRMREASAAAAAAAASEPASAKLPLPNFLAGDGTWVFLCPCGQVHDFEGMCDAGAAAAAVAKPQEQVEDVAVTEGVEAAASNVAVVEEVTMAQQPEAAAVPDTAVVAVEADRVAETPLQADAVVEPITRVQPQLEAEAAPLDVEETIARVQPQLEAEAAAPLDIEELAEQGLDGAALWLRRFEEALRALRGSPPGRPEAREAVSILLKLVRNVVERPHEEKFRRIKADNPRVRTSLLGAGAEAKALITLLGFEDSVDQGERVFLLRDAVFDTARLRMGQELLERELDTGSAQCVS